MPYIWWRPRRWFKSELFLPFLAGYLLMITNLFCSSFTDILISIPGYQDPQLRHLDGIWWDQHSAGCLHTIGWVAAFALEMHPVFWPRLAETDIEKLWLLRVTAESSFQGGSGHKLLKPHLILISKELGVGITQDYTVNVNKAWKQASCKTSIVLMLTALNLHSHISLFTISARITKFY